MLQKFSIEVLEHNILMLIVTKSFLIKKRKEKDVFKQNYLPISCSTS